MDTGCASPRHWGLVPCHEDPPLPIPVCAKGAEIGTGARGLQTHIIGMDTDAMGVHSTTLLFAHRGEEAVYSGTKGS